MRPGPLLVVASLTAYGLLALAAVSTIFVRRLLAAARLGRSGNDFQPPVTILKPLKGLDDSLQENIASFAAQDYPNLQIIFAAAQADDPALDVARLIAQQYPQHDIQVRVEPRTLGMNPKASLLMAIYPHAKHDIIIMSDSNARIARDFLKRNIGVFRDPRVGVAHSPVVGVGEASPPSAVENFQLTLFAGMLGICVNDLFRVPVAFSKMVILRKAAIDAAGGFRCVRHRAVEDLVLIVRIANTGWKLVHLAEPVQVVNHRWSWKQFLHRHIRWAGCRMWLSPWTYPLEMTINPVPAALIVLIVSWLIGHAAGLPFLLYVMTAKLCIDIFAVKALRGAWPRWRYLPLAPVRDVLIFGLWFVPLFSGAVEWRGHRLAMTRGTRLVRPQVLARAKARHHAAKR